MKLPRLTAESAIGPAMHCYVRTGAQPKGPTGTAIMPQLDIFGSLGCLLSCGIPNVLSTALQCGIDPACWITQVGATAAGCVSKCFS
jgi:hypothetical protein